MKAKKNLAFRLLATLPKEEHGKFLDFVNWYKSEILEFATIVLNHQISNNKELLVYKKFKPGTLRVYKSKLKDAILEYTSITSKEERLQELRQLAHVRSLNILGEDFMTDALIQVKKNLNKLEPFVKISLENIYYAEITRSIRVINKDSIEDIIYATNRGAEASQRLLQVWNIHNFYYQSIFLSKRFVILRSRENIELFNQLTNHSARFIKYADLSHESLKYYWLAANACIEYFNDDLTPYLQYVQKITEIGLEKVAMWGSNEATNKFILYHELAIAYSHAKNIPMFKKTMKYCFELLPNIPKSESMVFHAEYYNRMVILSSLESNESAPVQELLQCMEDETIFSGNVIQLYKVSIANYYFFSREYEKALTIYDEVINFQSNLKLSESELEEVKFFKILSYLSKITQLKETRGLEPNHFVYLNSMVNAYKEKVRKKKDEYQLEMLFIKSFSKLGFTSSLKDIKKEVQVLKDTLQQHEKANSIFYQVQFKRVFDYERWLNLILE